MSDKNNSNSGGTVPVNNSKEAPLQPQSAVSIPNVQPPTPNSKSTAVNNNNPQFRAPANLKLHSSRSINKDTVEGGNISISSSNKNSSSLNIAADNGTLNTSIKKVPSNSLASTSSIRSLSLNRQHLGKNNLLTSKSPTLSPVNSRKINSVNALNTISTDNLAHNKAKHVGRKGNYIQDVDSD